MNKLAILVVLLLAIVAYSTISVGANTRLTNLIRRQSDLATPDQ